MAFQWMSNSSSIVTSRKHRRCVCELAMMYRSNISLNWDLTFPRLVEINFNQVYCYLDPNSLRWKVAIAICRMLKPLHSLHFLMGGHLVCLLSQVNQLVGSVAKVVPKDGVIVAGDFNICSHSSHTRTLYSHLSSSMSGIGMKSIFTDLPYTHRAGSTLDHAFIGGRNLSLSNVSSQHSVHLTTEVKDLPVSDHDGLSFTINL